jgi:hypothetical protein
MRTWLIVSTAVIATGAVLYVQNRRDRADAERARVEIAALSASVAELRARSDDDGHRARRAQGKRPAPSPAEDAAYYERTFQQQSVDRAWASPAEETVSTRVRELLQGSAKLRSVECREWICRVEVSLSSDDEASPLARRLGEAGFWDGRSAYFHPPDADGKPALRSYLLRKGHTLPMPPR